MISERDIAESVVGLLREKAHLFEQFEAVTEQMMTDSFDEIDRIVECVEEREQLREQIDKLDQRIRDTAMQSPGGEQMIRASKNLCDYAEVKPEHQDIFTAGQEVFRIISRIQNADPQVSRNMEKMMEELQRRIRKNKTNTKFTGYINSMGIQASKGVLYDKKR